MDFKKKGAVWLWNGDNESINQYVSFRQNFYTESCEKACVYISCDTNYELWINGQFVNSGQYLALPENKFYDKLDIADYLKKGENHIYILVYYQGVGTQCYATGRPGVIYFIECDGKVIDNRDVYTAKSSGFVEGVIPLITRQLGPSFEYDARKERRWENSGENWSKAQILDFDTFLPEHIDSRPVKKLDISERTSFRLINKGTYSYVDENVPVAERMQKAFMCAEGVYGMEQDAEIVINQDQTCIIVDLGSENSGYFEIDITSEEGVQIDVSYGEHLADLRVRAHVGGRNFAFTYYCAEGRNTFTNYFRRLAGRYLQLNFSGVCGENIIHYVGIRKAQYPVNLKKRAEIKDGLHRQIYNTSIKTLRECMHEHYEDCPWREQALYGFDSRNQMLAGYTVFKNHEFPMASLYLLDSSLGEDGYQKMCVPQSIEHKIPGFSIMWSIAVCEYIENTGRFDDVKVLYQQIERMFDKYFECLENELLPVPLGTHYWNFYDWAEGLDGILKKDSGINKEDRRFDAIYNLYMCYALKKYIKVGKQKGFSVKKFTEYYKTLVRGVNNSFYDNKKGLYKTFLNENHYCQLVQSLAILADAATNKKQLRNSLVNDRNLVKTTLSTMIFKYEALIGDKAYREYVLNEIADIWGDMLYSGATTFYETEKGYEDFDNAGSLCHGWSAIPLIVYQYIQGEL